jgi:hypothetical protein
VSERSSGLLHFGDESRWAIDLGCRIYLSRVIRGAVARTTITRSRQTAADHLASFASVMLILGIASSSRHTVYRFSANVYLIIEKFRRKRTAMYMKNTGGSLLIN